MENSLVSYGVGPQGEPNYFQGYVAYPKDYKPTDKPRAAVISVHAWSGNDSYYQEKADMLAELGYIAFAADMYGQGRSIKQGENKMQHIEPLSAGDRAELRRRAHEAVNFVQTIEGVDAQKIAGIGFCFGGVTLLEYLRSGGNQLKGICGFHTSLGAGTGKTVEAIQGSILMCNGYEDPMVPNNIVLDFFQEMNEAKADWQFNNYSDAGHSFTDYRADEASIGFKFHERTYLRSMKAMQNFLAEVLV